MRRYITFFVTRQESVLLRSVISLYNAKANIPWGLSESESEPAELVFIGSEYHSAHLPPVFSRKADNGIASQQTVAMVSENELTGTEKNIYHLPPPLRATQILKILEQMESSNINLPGHDARTANIAPDSMVKMLHWPLQSLLRKNTAYLRLAVIASKKTMSPQQLASASGQSQGECLQYLQLLVDSGCAQIVQEENSAGENPENKPEKGKLLNIFSRIRVKLGIGSAKKG